MLTYSGQAERHSPPRLQDKEKAITFKILELSSGRLSLEFSASDLTAVREAIESIYGVPEITAYPACASVKFAGCMFVFQNEWNDPCLISQSEEGNRILKDLFESLRAETG
ncbi:hypothetical protein [Leisingera sp. ANG-S5]|uniref:hypothetical protein n=1 Tax=Leisingera sp. ANG-S5 TaxID=1577901 RepID=UPI0019D378F2|nr:hypothetical protein [Leisingera sp. ANG-S5]